MSTGMQRLQTQPVLPIWHPCVCGAGPRMHTVWVWGHTPTPNWLHSSWYEWDCLQMHRKPVHPVQAKHNPHLGVYLSTPMWMRPKLHFHMAFRDCLLFFSAMILQILLLQWIFTPRFSIHSTNVMNVLLLLYVVIVYFVVLYIEAICKINVYSKSSLPSPGRVYCTTLPPN